MKKTFKYTTEEDGVRYEITTDAPRKELEKILKDSVKIIKVEEEKKVHIEFICDELDDVD
ncbi:hypothetical protein LCGC14_0374230 [marine sediment metagenome]|uniref:Uncharacterized protein n=1 Tax=marine sediment metagenome TaxID=412755 RepID=A0A0F9WCV5_9ZZZZ